MDELAGRGDEDLAVLDAEVITMNEEPGSGEQRQAEKREALYRGRFHAVLFTALVCMGARAGSFLDAGPHHALKKVRRERPSPFEHDILPSGIQPEPVNRVGRDLERHGAFERAVGCRAHGEDIVRANIGDDEFVAGNKSDAIGAGRELLAADFDRHFRDEVGLVLSGHGG